MFHDSAEARLRQEGAAGWRPFLVERLWPRALSKGHVEVDAWEKEAGASGELRK